MTHFDPEIQAASAAKDLATSFGEFLWAVATLALFAYILPMVLGFFFPVTLTFWQSFLTILLLRYIFS